MKTDMKIAAVIVGGFAFFGLWLALTIFSTPVHSAEACAEPLDKVIASIEGAGGELLSLTDVHGVGFDQVLLADLGNSLVAGLALKGCLVTPPMPLGGIAPQVGV